MRIDWDNERVAERKTGGNKNEIERGRESMRDLNSITILILSAFIMQILTSKQGPL